MNDVEYDQLSKDSDGFYDTFSGDCNLKASQFSRDGKNTCECDPYHAPTFDNLKP